VLLIDKLEVRQGLVGQREGGVENLERNYHLKLQEMCDCYMETEFRKELQHMVGIVGDLEENSIKYLALALMCAVTEKAAKLSLKSKDGKVTVTVKSEDEKLALPAPSQPMFEKMVAIMRGILHLDEDKGKTALALGLRSGDLELQVKVERRPGKESLKFLLPPL
jgi:hypothetical protein